MRRTSVIGLGLIAIWFVTRLGVGALLARDIPPTPALSQAASRPASSAPIPTTPVDQATRHTINTTSIAHATATPLPVLPQPPASGDESPTPSPIAQRAIIEPSATIDQLDDFDTAVDHSSDLSFDTTNVGVISDDPSRLVRTARTAAWIVWATLGMTHFAAVTYHYPWEGIHDAFVFAASQDGETYVPITPTIIDRGGDWQRIDYILVLPTGTNFVQVTFPNTSVYHWTPQLGEVAVSP